MILKLSFCYSIGIKFSIINLSVILKTFSFFFSFFSTSAAVLRKCHSQSETQALVSSGAPPPTPPTLCSQVSEGRLIPGFPGAALTLLGMGITVLQGDSGSSLLWPLLLATSIQGKQFCTQLPPPGLRNPGACMCSAYLDTLNWSAISLTLASLHLHCL